MSFLFFFNCLKHQKLKVKVKIKNFQSDNALSKIGQIDTDPADSDPADMDPADTDPSDTDPADTDLH